MSVSPYNITAIECVASIAPLEFCAIIQIEGEIVSSTTVTNVTTSIGNNIPKGASPVFWFNNWEDVIAAMEASTEITTKFGFLGAEDSNGNTIEKGMYTYDRNDSETPYSKDTE